MFESSMHETISGEATGTSVLDSTRLRLRSMADGHERIEALLAAPPSTDALVQLDSISLDTLDHHDRISALVLWERHRSWLEARSQRALVAVAGSTPPARRLDDWGPEDVACALRLSKATAGLRIDVARELCGRLARTGAALESGAIGYLHARAVADALALLPDEVAAKVEDDALTGGHPDENLANFRRRLARAVIAADPLSADERHVVALGQRRIVSYPEPDGMASVVATVTADEAMTTMRALTSLAQLLRRDGDDRSIDLLRADAFADIFAVALADPKLPSEQRARPAVGMSIDAATLMRLAEHPGHLDGYGAIPPVMARRIAASGDWHRLVTDPVTGALLDYGRKTYRPPDDLVQLVVARDRTCQFLSCNRPARLCDVDHVVSWEDGGSTSATNNRGLCRRDHRLKTFGGWSVKVDVDGALTWTNPSGHRYRRPAVDHCPEHTAHLRERRKREGDPPDRWDPHVEPPPEDGKVAVSDPPSRHSPAPEDAVTTDLDPDTSGGDDPPPF